MAIHRVNGRAWNVETRGPTTAPALLLLHGFTGCAAEMLRASASLTEFQCIAFDLPGHGASDDATSWPEVLWDLHALVNALVTGPAHLWGYSQGGRVALAYAAAHPERVAKLVLESASPGLATEEARRARRGDDEVLAKRATEGGTAAFIELWEQLSLFEGELSLPVAERDVVRSERNAHRAEGLASALRVLGTGAQPSQWDALATLPHQTLLLTGARDAKFTAIAEQMRAKLPHATHVQIPNAGHGAHREAAEATAQAVGPFLRNRG